MSKIKWNKVKEDLDKIQVQLHKGATVSNELLQNLIDSYEEFCEVAKPRNLQSKNISPMLLEYLEISSLFNRQDESAITTVKKVRHASNVLSSIYTNILKEKRR